MNYDILVIGNATVDLIFTGLPGLPELGKEVYSQGFDMIPGEAYNSAIALHRLEVRVGWAADFGDDDFSRFIIERARAEGLDESLFVHHKRPFRRISVACSLPEDRAFITYYDPDPPVPAALKALASVSARALYIPGFFYGSLFDAGRKLTRLKGMKLVMDGNTGIDITLENPAVRRAAEGVDLLLANALEARRLTGENDLEKAIHHLDALGPLVVVKDGPRGAYACVAGKIVHAPAIPVTALDTTGAGDCFNAGFLRAWLDRLPIEECLRWGNVVGGLSTTARGATGKVVTRAEVEEWLMKK
jgi:sugar/nucleoside kinase (ribokinase family)